MSEKNGENPEGHAEISPQTSASDIRGNEDRGCVSGTLHG